MDKLSVFGASGFIGNEFCNKFPHRSIAMDRDVTTPTTNRVLYLVSTVDNYNVLTNPFIDIETNLLHLMDVLSKCQATSEFNFISSWFVYGKGGNIQKRETDYCDPTGFYSITKRCAEQLIVSYCETFGIKYRILRLANVIGIGDKKISRKKNALQYMIRELAQGREIPLYKGKYIRDFIDVRDAVQAIDLVVNRGEHNEIYNIGNGEPESIRDLISYAWFESGKMGTIKDIDAPHLHKVVQSDHVYLDISKLKNLGYHRDYTTKQTIQDLIEHYKNG